MYFPEFAGNIVLLLFRFWSQNEKTSPREELFDTDVKGTNHTGIFARQDLPAGFYDGQIFQWDSGSPMLADKYELYGYQSARCITLHGDNMENDAIIDLWDCQHKENQKWTITTFDWSDPSTGKYALVNSLSGKCLTAGTRGGEPVTDADGQIHLYQYACDTQKNPYQLWKINGAYSYKKYWFIKNVATEKCVSVSKGWTSNGAAMTLWACDYTTPSTNQLWNFW